RRNAKAAVSKNTHIHLDHCGSINTVRAEDPPTRNASCVLIRTAATLDLDNAVLSAHSRADPAGLPNIRKDGTLLRELKHTGEKSGGSKHERFRPMAMARLGCPTSSPPLSYRMAAKPSRYRAV